MGFALRNLISPTRKEFFTLFGLMAANFLVSGNSFCDVLLAGQAPLPDEPTGTTNKQQHTMKKQLIAITAAAPRALFTVITAVAQPSVNPKSKTTPSPFVQGVNAEKNITIGISPSYAPDLINASGVKTNGAQWVSLTTTRKAQSVNTPLPVSAWIISVQILCPVNRGGLKADVQIFGVNVTPFAYTGAAVPLSRAGDQNGDWGTIVGGGAKVSAWNGKLLGLNANLSVGLPLKWSQFDGMIYRGAFASLELVKSKLRYGCRCSDYYCRSGFVFPPVRFFLRLSVKDDPIDRRAYESNPAASAGVSASIPQGKDDGEFKRSADDSET